MDYRIDLFAIFILLGIVQAVFLSFFFLSKENRLEQPNLFQGMLLISTTLCVVEIFLMYTGYIVNCLYLVDFSEPFSFVIGPSFYLLVMSIIYGRVSKKQYLHFAFPLIYVFLVLPFFLASDDLKYNSWVGAYHPDLPFRQGVNDPETRWFWVTDNHTEMAMLSLVIYAVLGTIEVVRAFDRKKESFLNPVNPVLRKLWSGTIQILAISAVILIIKFFNEDDTGDHIFAAYISVAVYFTSFSVIRHSVFFRNTTLAEIPKYKSSPVNIESQALLAGKLKNVMKEKKPFLQPDFSLPDLALQLETSVHVLSRTINENLGKNFFEMVAEYRIQEAMLLLKESPALKVEGVAIQVGYNSKSSFNTAFKKITGKTPSEFRNVKV